MLHALSTLQPRPAFAPAPSQAARTEVEAGNGAAGIGRVPGALHARASLQLDASDLGAAWLEAIHEARTTLKVDLDALLGPDGDALTRALLHRASQGVRVQVLAWGPLTAEREARIAGIRQRGLLVRPGAGGATNPVGRLLVADDRIALVGAQGPARGTVARAGLLRLAGEAAWELGRLFNHDWAATGGHPAQLPDRPPSFASSGGAAVRVGGVGPSRRTARGVLLAALQGARQSIDVLADVVTDPDVIGALKAAEARGVAVRVLLDEAANGTDAAWLAHLGLDATAASTDALRASGLPTGVLTTGSLALRAAVVDGETIVFSTAPWTRQGLAAAGEWVVTVHAPDLAALLGAAFASDWATAAPLAAPRTPLVRGLALLQAAVRPALAALTRLAAQVANGSEVRVGVVRIAGRWRVLADTSA